MKLRLVALGAIAAAAGTAAAILLTGPQPHRPASIVGAVQGHGRALAPLDASVAPLQLTVISQTSTKVTLGWTPPAGIAGYEFTLDGKRVSNTWDPSRSQITFGKPDSGSHVYEVDALTVTSAGSQTAPTPSTATAPTTTTVPTTTTAPSSPTFASETSYPPAPFTATKTVDVSSQAAFMSAWNSIVPDEQINVHGVTFTGEVVLANKKLSDWAQISFDSTTRFVGPSSAVNLPSLWIHDDSHIRFYGGDFSDSASGGMAGSAILVYGSTYVTLWGFKAHDTGGTALAIYPVSSIDDHLDVKGEVYDWGHNLAWDPHTEKGSGLHGLNIGDANYGVTNSRIAIYAHDGKTGAGIEWGGKDGSGSFQGNTFYVWCQNLSFVAKIQTGGNCMQVWGQNVFHNTIAYLEAENLQGAPYFSGGLYSGQSLTTDTVLYGRASNTNLNAAEIGTARWDTKGSTLFRDVAPLP